MAVFGVPRQAQSSAREMAERARLESCAQVSVYRPFFVCGVVTVLTAGCLLGALALLGLSQRGSYTVSAWTPYVLAHANSQLYGWVGFFVMGFSLQRHAPSVARQRLFHRLAWASLGIMAAGIVLRFLAEPLAVSGDRFWIQAGVFSAVLQVVAAILFVTNTMVTRYRPKVVDGSNVIVLGQRPESMAAMKNKPMTWPTSFVMLSLICLLVGVGAEPFAFALSHQASQLASIQFVAEWFPPLRDVQFLGFVASMVFGVGLSKFHECFGTPKADAKLGIAGFVLWIVGLVCRTVGWLVYFRGGLEQNQALLYRLGAVLLLSAVVLIVGSAGVFAKLSGQLRSHKFIRAAFAWLLIAGAMLVVEPYVLSAIGRPFSHAFTGAVRHAVTVGFISQMIIGFSSRVVPSMLDIEEAVLPKLWPTFVLLNAGNALRVGCEVATDFTPSAFGLMGVTGFVELVGLLLWGTHILGLLLRSRTKKASYGML